MKSVCLKFFLVLQLLGSDICFAQHNVVKVDALGLLYPGLTVFRPSYERNFGKYTSLLLNFEIGTYETGSSGKVGSSTVEEQYSMKGWGFMPEFRAYPFGKKKDAPVGFFFGVHLRHRWLHENYQGKDNDVPSNNGFPPTPAPVVNVKGQGSLTDFGWTFGYKAKAGKVIFEPLIGYGVGIASGFSYPERSKINSFYTEDGVNSPFHRLRLQFSIGFIISGKPKGESEVKTAPAP
jgi:hypothetical protein